MALEPHKDHDPHGLVNATSQGTDGSLNRADMLERTLARQIEAIRAADLKMALLVPTTSAMAGVLAALYRGASQELATSVAFIAALLPMVGVFVMMALTALPRFRAGRPNSLMFFGAIAGTAEADFAARLRNMPAGAYFDDLARQCHVTATIALAKHRMVRRAYICFLCAVCFWIVALSMLSVYRAGPLAV